MKNIIVVPRSPASLSFLMKLLGQLHSVKEVKTSGIPVSEKTVKKKKIIPFAAISESSLAKEWLSVEDNIWDEWYENKKKNS